MPILLVLLLSLCVSRGEGIHLFPFDDCGTATASAAGTAEVTYNFSIINQESSPVLKKQELPSHNEEPADAKCEIPWSVRSSAPDTSAATPSLSLARLCSKSLHGSVSDRSPPYSV